MRGPYSCPHPYTPIPPYYTCTQPNHLPTQVVKKQPASEKGQPVHFSVPTGNFGDVLAGYYAKRMGLPVGKLVVGTNENDILARFFQATRREGHGSRRGHVERGQGGERRDVRG